MCESGRVTALGFNPSLPKKKRKKKKKRKEKKKSFLAGHWGAYCDSNAKEKGILGT